MTAVSAMNRGGRKKEPTDGSVSLRQLMLFNAVAQRGNLTHGARDCGLSQPAATQSLSVLQDSIGFPLIEGRSRGITLTAAGSQFQTRFASTLQRLHHNLAQIGIANTEQLIWHLSRAQLRILEAMRLRGSVAKAAIALGLTRSSAMRGLRSLEERFGSRLIELREGDGVLTGIGITLADLLSGVSSEVALIIWELRDFTNHAASTITIGVAPNPGTAGLNQVIRDQLNTNADSRIEIVELGQDELLPRLAIGELDLVVGHVPECDREGIEWELLSQTKFCVVGRKGHPLSQKKLAPLRDLAEQTWLFGARETQRRLATDIMFAGRPQPKCALVTAAAPLMAQVMQDSDMIALLTEQELAVRRDTLCEIPHEAPNIKVSIGWACRTEWEATAPHLCLIDLLRTHLGSRKLEAANWRVGSR